MEVDKTVKGIDDMVSVSMKINRIIKTPSKKPTKAEAAQMLRSYGVLDQNNRVKPEYKKIFSEGSRHNNDVK